jgi:D-alanyl-D-alanine carboxypeptidase
MNKCPIILLTLIMTAALGRGEVIDDIVKLEMRKQHIPAMSIAVLREGKLVKAQGYGLASVELGVHASQETLYEIASVTKPFTAMAIMLLAEESRINLDAALGKYAPKIPEAWKRITIRQILNHTGGVPLNAFNLNPATERLEYTRQDILKLISAMPLLFEPGERFEYSNLGYYLLGIVIEEASGMTFADFLDARIFRPLGMRSTRLNDYSVIMPNRARGYEWQGELRLGAYQSPSSYAPAGGIVSTAVDMATWDAAFSKQPLLKQNSLEQIWAPARLRGGGSCAYGLGWNLDYVRGRRDVNHRGSNAGFSSTLHRYMDDGLTVIVLANLAAADLERVACGIVGCFVPELAPLSSMEARPDPHPAWTVQLREGLSQLSQGGGHPIFSNEFSGEFDRLNRVRALSARLEKLKAFSFLDSRPVAKWRGNRPGGVVDRLEYYRLVSGSRVQGYIFSVDAAGRVLWVEIEEDPTTASEMEQDSDDAPALTQAHQELALGWASGRNATTGMTPGLKQLFTEDVLRAYQRRLMGMTGFQFINSLDTRGDQLARFGCEVTQIRYYRVTKTGLPLFMTCYLGANGELADVDLSRQ